MKPLVVEKNRLIIDVDGKWTAEDIAKLFSALTNLYHYCYSYYIIDNVNLNIFKSPKKNDPAIKALEPQAYSFFRFVLAEEINNEHLKKLYDPRKSFPPLIVSRLSYASPGSFDLVGFAEALKQLKEIIFKYLPNKEDKINWKIKEQELLEKEIKNLKLLGFDDQKIQKIIVFKQVNEAEIMKLITEEKIQSIE